MTVATQTPRSSAPRASEAVTITCIQPGGGFCFDLARRWGAWRRWWLRRLRPGYVRRMAERRQGACPACPHDIVDARDLVPVRNVCGFAFAPEDDAFRWRDRLGLARTGLPEVVVSSLACATAIAPLAVAATRGGWWPLWLPVATLLVLWWQMVRFFRDPERPIPDDPRALLAPSDGVVTHLHEVDDPDFPGGRAFRISVYLSPWDVHLNRVPRHGRVVATRYFPGEFVRARREDCAVRNEQLWTDFEEPNGRRVRVKQISGAMARRLVCWLRPGEAVSAGARFGLIKYGSRSDVLVPADEPRTLAVAVGDRVRAGSTVLWRYPDQAAPR